MPPCLHSFTLHIAGNASPLPDSPVGLLAAETLAPVLVSHLGAPTLQTVWFLLCLVFLPCCKFLREQDPLYSESVRENTWQHIPSFSPKMSSIQPLQSLSTRKGRTTHNSLEQNDESWTFWRPRFSSLQDCFWVSEVPYEWYTFHLRKSVPCSYISNWKTTKSVSS